jgi:hypothetical protein
VRRIGPSAWAAAVAMTAATSALAACGGESEQDRVRAAVLDLQRAYADDQPRRACLLLTFDAQREAGDAAHGRAGLCPGDVRRAWGYLRGSTPAAYATAPPVTAVAVDGDRATATIAPARGMRADVPLRREDGSWRVDSFFGARERDAWSGAPRPPGRERGWRAGDRLSCPPVSVGDDRRIRGGCTAIVHGGISLVVRTVFATSVLARCSYRLVVRVDGHGRTWTKPLSFSNEGACGDVVFCTDDRGERVAWTGQLRRERGGLRHHVDLCLDTCIGSFAGPMEMTGHAGPRGRLELTSLNAEIGRGGLELDTTWRLRAGPEKISSPLSDLVYDRLAWAR